MKTPSSAVKVLTVSVFTLLIVCFVCYRVGAFDTITYGHYESSSTMMAVDTPIVAQDSLVLNQQTIEIMSSSKSMVMPRTLKQDTVKKSSTDTTKKKPLKKSTTMSSSKSGFIYEPESESDTTTKPKK